MVCVVDATRWDLVDTITTETVTYRETDPTCRELIGKLTVAPRTGLPFAIAALYGMWVFFSAVAGFLTDRSVTSKGNRDGSHLQDCA
ncbi:hypothetical protein [Salinigranum halophilum]|uniref:hypothetical protein n=1 Tax=Salinigranum halophilum TaxID=2565931 RepID=UPI0010A8DA9E|nr:hypothetical protein [Salinigranum halophilum]